MNFHENLKRLCEDRRIEPADVIAALGGLRKKDVVYGWFNGKGYPDLETALVLARFLDVSLDTLVGREGAAEAEPTAAEMKALREIARGVRHLLGVYSPNAVETTDTLEVKERPPPPDRRRRPG